MDLKFLSALPVGDETASVKAVSFHQNPTLFGQKVKNVFAVVTSEAVLIYHKSGATLDKILRHRWMKDVVVCATSLDWHPFQAELFVGDEEGHITVFKYEEEITDEGICPYIFNRVYKNKQSEKVCSLSWSQDGNYLAAAFTHNLVMFCRYRGGFMEKIINLERGPCNYIVKFHPVESYLFVSAENNPFLKVFTNLTPDMKQQTEWRQIICTQCASGVRALCFDGKEIWNNSIVLATAGKSPRVWRFHGYEVMASVISEPKLCLLDLLDEDSASKGQLNSITFHNDASRKYIVCGFDNGTFSLYKASSKRNANDNKKILFVSIKKKWAGHKFYPSVTCLLSHPKDSSMVVGGSYGFVHFFRLICKETETKKPGQDIKETQRPPRFKVGKIQGNIEREMNYYVSPSRQMEPDVIGTHQQLKAFVPQFGSSLVPDVEAVSLSQAIPGQQKIRTSHPRMFQQQQDLQSTCLSLQQAVDQLRKQLELIPLQSNLPAAQVAGQQQMPQQQMPSQQAQQLLLQQQSALKSTYLSSQDLLQKLQELMQLIQQQSNLNQQPAAQDCHTQLQAPGSIDPKLDHSAASLLVSPNLQLQPRNR